MALEVQAGAQKPALKPKRGLLRRPSFYALAAALTACLLFAWFSFGSGLGNGVGSRSIVIDNAQTARLAKSFEDEFQRAPTPQEMDGLIREYIKDEVYYREAVRLGLDRNDPVIRRHMREKIEAIARAKLESAKPDDAVLQQLLDKNPGKYAEDTRYSFDQIFLNAFDPEIAGAKAEATLAKLKDTADWKGLSEPLTVPASIDDMPQNEIAGIFGEQFASELGRLSGAPTNQWLGPIGSGFGIHLLRIRGVSASAKPKLSDVRQLVEKDWSAATLEAREAKAYQALLDSYSVDHKAVMRR
jgi:peptidyl-prolyl cis-trans isomerase C